MYFYISLINMLSYRACKTGILTLFVICLGTLNASPSVAKIQVSSDFSYTYDKISGPGKDQSSLTDGHKYLNILDVTGNGVSGNFDYFYNIGAQFTNDRKIDSQTFLLTNLKAGISNDTHSLNLGDIYREFSQYGLSTSIKGGAYSFRKEGSELPEFEFIYGYANSRWDNFHGFGQSYIDSIKRKVVGGKVNYNNLNDFKAGLSIVSTDDSERVSNSDELYDIISYTLGWEWAFIPRLKITGESSLADTTLYTSSEAADTELEGYAHKLTLTGDGGPGKLTIQLEKVSPDYRTVVGSAISDREKAKVKLQYKYNEQHTITSGFLWYRNNLDGTKDTRSDHYMPEINLITQNLLGRKNASTGISYKLDITKQNNTFTSRVDHIINLNYKDRFGIIDSNSNFGFTSYEYKTDQKQKNLEYTYNTSLNADFSYDDFTLKPGLRFGGWASREEMSNLTDRIYEYSLATDLHIPSAKITSNIQIGQNKLEKETGTDSLKSFVRFNIFYKSDFLQKTQYGMIFLKAYINDYNFDNVDGDFRETSITSGINIKF